MDNDDNHHRPPVLLQSDDHDLDSRRSSQHLLTALALHANEDSGHVHSQTCQDSCPVQDIYTELSYSRFSKGARTNLFGLVVVKELSKSTPPLASRPPSPQFRGSPVPKPTENIEPSQDTAKEGDPPILTSEQREASADHSGETEPTPEATGALPAQESAASLARTKTSIFTASGSLAFRHLPARYVLVAAGSIVKCFLGLEESFEFTVCGPANQEIVSMDAFERVDDRGCQLVVTVAIAKAEEPAQFEIRCYGANTFGKSIKELVLGLPNSIDIQTIPVSWAPTKITHSPLDDDPFEMAILVGGSDSCVHFYLQDESSGVYSEKPIESYFSVLSSFPYCEYCVLSLTIKDYPTYRVVAAGTQNGTLNVGIIPRDPVTLKLDRANAKSHTIVLFAPITTLTIFTSRVQTHNSSPTQDLPSPEGIHLLVTCAIEQVWVYSDIDTHGLLKRTDLAECSYHDSILAAHVMDADWDGQNELLIGTYGRQLMVFKGLPSGQLPYSNAEYASSHASHLNQQLLHHQHNHQHETRDHIEHRRYYGMTWNRRFASPVYGISSADLNNDGLEELIITTLNGVSFFVPDPITAKRRLSQAIERMKEIEEMKLTLERLRASNQELFDQQRIREEQELQRLQEEQERQRVQEEEERKRLIEEALQRQQQLEEEKERERRALEQKMQEIEREREEERKREMEQEEARVEAEVQEQHQLELVEDTQASEKVGGQEDAEGKGVEQDDADEPEEGQHDQAQSEQDLETEQPNSDSEPKDDDAEPSQTGVEEPKLVELTMEPNSVQEQEATKNVENVEDGGDDKGGEDNEGLLVKDEDKVPNKDAEHPETSAELSAEPSADIHSPDQDQDHSQDNDQVARVLAP